jgi:hypothetical protein
MAAKKCVFLEEAPGFRLLAIKYAITINTKMLSPIILSIMKLTRMSLSITIKKPDTRY